MRIRILTVGSRGDLQPYLPLTLELVRAGHDARLVANSDLREHAERNGVPFDDLGFHVADVLKSTVGSQMLSSRTAFGSRKHLIRAVAERIVDVSPRINGFCSGADLLLSSETLHLVARSISEAIGARLMALCLIPWGSSRHLRNIYADQAWMKLLPAGMTHEFVVKYGYRRILPAVNRLRRETLHLPELGVSAAYRMRERCPTLYGYSPSLAPPPPDWPSNRVVTGSWFLPDPPDHEPDPALRAFVDAGERPVCVGFGSMVHDPLETLTWLREAWRATGQRFVFLSGWSDTEAIARLRLPPEIHVAREASHAWLFPRVSAVVHHGGAGTTAAAAAAGIPQLISWFIVDQSYWARRIRDLRIGEDLGHHDGLTSATLIAALARTRADGATRARADALGREVRAEHGTVRAVAEIEQMFAVR